MRIIDKNGRLFGKLNVIDFSFILFLIWIIISISVTVVNISSRKQVKQEEKYQTEVVIDCVFKKIDPQIVTLAVGDKEVRPDGIVVGEIIELTDLRPNEYIFEFGDGSFIKRQDRLLKEAGAKLRLIADGRGKKLYYNDKALDLGSEIKFKTNLYTLTGVLVSYSEVGFSGKWVSVEAEFRGLMPEVAEVLKEKDFEVNEYGKEIVVLESVMSRRPAALLNFNGPKALIVQDPERIDITAKLKVLAAEKRGLLYFKNYPLKIGSFIGFAPELYEVSGRIKKIY